MDPSDLDRKDVRRPMNAFLIFCKRHRSIVREKNPNLDNRSVTRILGDLWANLGEDEKSQYTDLAKQYKDAFMKANPDYKWHNPERVTPPASNKPNTRPTNVRVLKSEHEISIEGQITPGKLADPSNMGGLSLLLDSSKYSPSSIGYKIDEKQFLQEADSTSSDTLTGTSLYSSLLQNERHFNVKSELNVDDVEMKMPPYTEENEETENQNSEQIGTTTEDKGDKENDVNGNRFKDNETDYSELTNEEPLSLVQKKENVQDIYSANQDCKEQLDMNIVTSYGTKVSDRDPITGCGQRVMDHIIERLYTIEQHHSDNVNDLKLEETTVKSSSPSLDEVDGTSKISEKTKMSTKEQEGVEFDKTIVKLPLSPQKSGEGNDSTAIRKRKRCYSESNVDTYESTKPIVKKEKIDFEEEFHEHQDLEIDRCSQADELPEQSESASQDTEKTDHDSADDDNHPIRKSKRRNRGQRYQELINEGIIQPSRERLASMKGENIVKEECTTEDTVDNKEDELTQDVLSVYPRQIRKRAVSESEKTKPNVEDMKRYKTGDFDLEAHIATLPACSLEKVARNAKRSIIKVRSHSDSCKKSDTDKSDVILALPVPPHLKLKNFDDSGPPPTGSQKRKARKHSVTRLIPVSSSAGISLVAVKTDHQDEDIHLDNSNKQETIAKCLLDCEKTSDEAGDACCHGNNDHAEKHVKMDSCDDVVEKVHKENNEFDSTKLTCKNTDDLACRVAIVIDSSECSARELDVKIAHDSKRLNAQELCKEVSSPCEEKGNLNLQRVEKDVEKNFTEFSNEQDSDNKNDKIHSDFEMTKLYEASTISCSVVSSSSDESVNLHQESACVIEVRKSADVHLNEDSENVKRVDVSSFYSDNEKTEEGKQDSTNQQSDSLSVENGINSSGQTTRDIEQAVSVSVSCDLKEGSFSNSLSSSIGNVQTSTDQTISHTTSVQSGMSIAVPSS